MRFLIILLITITPILSVNGQTILYSENDIIKITKHVNHSLEKLEHRPKSKQRADKFIHDFDKINNRYTKKLEMGMNNSIEKNWESIMNSLTVLNHIHSMANESKVASSLVDIKDYNSEITKQANEAVDYLYNKGKMAMENNDDIYSYQVAYESFYRASLIHPNYKDIDKLMKIVELEGSKDIVFNTIKPFNYSSLNQVSIEFGNTYGFIIDEIINDVSKEMIGSKLMISDNDMSADWVVEIGWKYQHNNPGSEIPNKFHRVATITENGKTKQVTAEVTHFTKYQMVTGTLMCKVKDNVTQEYIYIEEFEGSDNISIIRITYTGDKRALTAEDNRLMHSNYQNQSNPELIRKMYETQIHPQILNSLGPLLNWKYRYLHN